MPVRMSGLVSNLDTESIIASLMSAQKTKQTKIENKITKLEWKQDKWKNLNTKMFSFYSDTLSKFRMQNSFATKKASSSNETLATVTASNTAAEGSHSLSVKQLASSQFVTGAQLSADDNSLAITTNTKLVDLNMTAGNQISVTAGTVTKNLTIDDKTTVSDFLTTLRNAGLSASYDTTQKRFFISSKQSGSENAFTLTATNPSELSGLGLSEITKTTTSDRVTMNYGSNITLVQPKDSKYTYNGVEFTSSSNNIAINGVSITIKGVTPGANTDDPTDDIPINLNISNDTQAVYDMVKSFVSSYNTLLKEMNTSFYADSAAGFEPLSDDDKKAMSDDEIKKWEDKIKDSLLRRDSTLGSLITSMRSKLGGSVMVNGKSYSLSSYGISTSSDYSEKGLLHIDGNTEDSTTAIKTDKLMEALTKNPDTVAEVLTQLAGNLYSDLQKNMSSNKLRSALTFYNDKEMKNTLKDYNSDLKTMEKKLKDMEDRYYKQFSAMETALAKMNSQSSSLASMLGTKS